MKTQGRISNTSERLAQVMEGKDLRQTDVLKLCEPYLEKYGVKMNKSDISQYLAGKSEPNQKKLIVLSEALKVSISWLMGFDTDSSVLKEDSTCKVNRFKHSFLLYLQDISDEDWEIVEKFTDILIKIKEKV